MSVGPLRASWGGRRSSRRDDTFPAMDPRTRLLAAGPTLFLALGACDTGPDPGLEPNGPPDAPRAWEEVVITERTFARAASDLGARSAFIQHISPSGILFRPAPVAGLPALEDGPEFPGRLEWAPAVAHVSADGDLGFTSGPFRFTPDDGGVAGTGWYVTIWRRDAGESFRFELDVGVGGPAPATFPDSVAALGPLYPRTGEGHPDDGGLLALDGTYRRSYGSFNLPGLQALRFNPDVFVLREGRPAARGSQVVLAGAARANASGGLLWHAQGSRLADDGTLGYVYGMAARPAPGGAPGESGPAFPFVHIWRRLPDGSWELLLDLLGVPEA